MMNSTMMCWKMTKGRRSGRARNLILSGVMLNNRPGKWIQGTACLPNVEQASQIFLEQRNRKKSNAKSLGSRKILVKS